MVCKREKKLLGTYRIRVYVHIHIYTANIYIIHTYMCKHSLQIRWIRRVHRFSMQLFAYSWLTFAYMYVRYVCVWYIHWKYMFIVSIIYLYFLFSEFKWKWARMKPKCVFTVHFPTNQFCTFNARIIHSINQISIEMPALNQEPF